MLTRLNDYAVWLLEAVFIDFFPLVFVASVMAVLMILFIVSS
jgi:hypothetical protein